MTQKDKFLDLFFKFSICFCKKRTQEITDQEEKVTDFSFLFLLAEDIYPYPYLIDYTGIPFIEWKLPNCCVWTGNK